MQTRGRCNTVSLLLLLVVGLSESACTITTGASHKNRGNGTAQAIQGPALSAAQRQESLSSSAPVRARSLQVPLHFEANQGQTDPQVKFLARGHGYTLFLTATEMVLALQNVERGMSRNAERWMLN